MADQSKRIVFQNEIGGVSVLIPPRDEDCDLTINEIAAKDVPTGKPYAIVDVSDIPTERYQRSAWTVNESDLTDGVGE